MSLWSRLFGGVNEPESTLAVVEDYKGFRIIPEPMSEEGGFRLAAKIEAEIDGETKSHHLIRADVIRDREAAETAAILKAKQMIDQMGPRLFG